MQKCSKSYQMKNQIRWLYLHYIISNEYGVRTGPWHKKETQLGQKMPNRLIMTTGSENGQEGFIS